MKLNMICVIFNVPGINIGIGNIIQIINYNIPIFIPKTLKYDTKMLGVGNVILLKSYCTKLI